MLENHPFIVSSRKKQFQIFCIIQSVDKLLCKMYLFKHYLLLQQQKKWNVTENMLHRNKGKFSLVHHFSDKKKKEARWSGKCTSRFTVQFFQEMFFCCCFLKKCWNVSFPYFWRYTILLDKIRVYSAWSGIYSALHCIICVYIFSIKSNTNPIIIDNLGDSSQISFWMVIGMNV